MERFPQYKLGDLLAEDVRLLRFVNIVDMARGVGDG